jgi:hypothetical protein
MSSDEGAKGPSMCAGHWLLWDGEVIGRDPEAIRGRVVVPDDSAVFPDERAVNEALPLVMQWARILRPDPHGVVEP